MDYSGLPLSKGEPRSIRKARQRKGKGPTAKARASKARKRLKDYKAAAREVLTKIVGNVLDGFIPCGECGRWTEAIQMHHVKLRSLAPERRTDPTNLIQLCPTCHDKKHARRWSQQDE